MFYFQVLTETVVNFTKKIIYFIPFPFNIYSRESSFPFGEMLLECYFNGLGNKKVSRGKIILQIVSQAPRSFTDSPSSKFPNFFEPKFVAII